MYRKLLLSMFVTFLILKTPSYAMEDTEAFDLVTVSKPILVKALDTQNKELEVNGRKFKIKVIAMEGGFVEFFRKYPINYTDEVCFTLKNNKLSYHVDIESTSMMQEKPMWGPQDSVDYSGGLYSGFVDLE